ncbi:MoxR-like ATPase [Pseudomonas sp. JUb42]|jgi:MoxR-like ATPase|nr:MoxR-like ATPase [Pseudomonas sp. JUb42]
MSDHPTEPSSQQPVEFNIDIPTEPVDQAEHSVAGEEHSTDEQATVGPASAGNMPSRLKPVPQDSASPGRYVLIQKRVIAPAADEVSAAVDTPVETEPARETSEPVAVEPPAPTAPDPDHQTRQRQRASHLAQAIRHELRKAVIGQDAVIDDVLTALIGGGHVLLEGVPGLGKTLLVRALARCFGGDFARIQFTPDLMPSDVTGHAVYDLQTEQFKLRKGPLFTNLLLADEINRAPAKTQAALLEAMQERQVTLEGRALPIAQPFMVLATQNPIEQEGTYPLPEAELDRFMLKLRMDYPQANEELAMVRQVTRSSRADMLDVQPLRVLMHAREVQALQRIASELPLDEQVLDYAVRLARATRTWPGFTLGAGPRASIALVRGARARALLRGGEFVVPDDVKGCALAVLRHRVRLSPELDIEGLSVDQVLRQMLDQVPAPRL